MRCACVNSSEPDDDASSEFSESELSEVSSDSSSDPEDGSTVDLAATGLVGFFFSSVLGIAACLFGRGSGVGVGFLGAIGLLLTADLEDAETSLVTAGMFKYHEII
jgi:hypothetical protein